MVAWVNYAFWLAEIQIYYMVEMFLTVLFVDQKSKMDATTKKKVLI